MEGFRGKVVGENWYIHKDSMVHLESKEVYNQFINLEKSLSSVKNKLVPDPFDYVLVKLHVHLNKLESVTFLYISGWNKYSEPILSRSIKIDASLHGVDRIKVREYNGNSAPVYHHKWTMITPDVAKFDYDAAISRSKEWEKNPIFISMQKLDHHIKSRIGFKGQWQNLCSRMGVNCDY
jgi:hypothetical protein